MPINGGQNPKKTRKKWIFGDFWVIFGHFASFSLLSTVLALPNEASKEIFQFFFRLPKLDILPQDRDFRANGTLLGQGEVEKVDFSRKFSKFWVFTASEGISALRSDFP